MYEKTIISAQELLELRRDREWADHFCKLFIRAGQRGDLDLMARHSGPLYRYARIRNLEI